MPLKLHPNHPTADDLNAIYGARHVGKLAAAHRRLGKRFRVGDHIEHVPGISPAEVRRWRAEIRAFVPPLARALLHETIVHGLTAQGKGGASGPMPIKFTFKRGRRSGWHMAISEQGGKISVEIAGFGLPKAKTAKK